MKKINLAITGCIGRMGQQLIRTNKNVPYLVDQHLLDKENA